MTPKERLVGLKGREYFEELERVLAEVGPAVIADFKAVEATTGNFTVGDLIKLADRYELPFKGTCQYLEERGIIRDGSYDIMQSSGLNLRKMREHLAGAVDPGWSTEPDEEGEN